MEIQDRQASPKPNDRSGDSDGRIFLTRVTEWGRGPLSTVAVAASGLFMLALFYTLFVGRAFFIPLLLAVFLNFLLSPVVRALRRIRVPAPLGSAVLLIALLGIVTFGLYNLSGPASDWIENAPERLQQAEYKLRGIQQSIEKVEEATKEIDKIADGENGEASQRVDVEQTTLSESLMSQTRQMLVGIVVTGFLLYFLLASQDLFLRKLVRVLPQFRQKRNTVRIVRRTEQDLSHYLATVTLINICLGGSVSLAFYLLGMPNPLLWGVMAALLNFIPYIGGLVGIAITTLVAIVSFDSVGQALLIPLAYLGLNTLESYVLTPFVMGRRLVLNPVAVFISIIFWGWILGIAGAILAVPILVALKIICDNVDALSPVGVFLGR